MDPIVKVSVLMVTYNHERYLASALESVLAQETDFDFEVVVGEDCSTDGTRGIAREYEARHPGKVRLLLRETNLGMMRNFEDTYRNCRGRYVALLDGDDYWTCPRKLQSQAEFLDSHPGYTLCFHPVAVVGEEGGEVSSWPPGGVANSPGIEDLLELNVIPSCSAMYRIGVVERFPGWMLALDIGDWPFNILHAQHGKVGFLPETMAAYRVHPDGSWSSQDTARKMGNVIRFYDAVNAHLAFRYDRTVRMMKSYYFHELALLYLGQKNGAEARKLAWKSLATKSFNRKLPPWVQLKTLAKLYLAAFAT